MVDVLGHLGMALIWLAPGWYFFDRPKVAGTFVAVSFWFGMLPDVDLVISNYLGTIHHHGIFHTVLVVTILAAVIGPVVGKMFENVLEAEEGQFAPAVKRNAALLGIAGVWVAATSHLFADILSAPDASTVIEPLWPLYHGPIVLVDVLFYQSFWARWGLLILGLAINAGMAYWASKYRVSTRESSVKREPRQ